MKPFLSYVAIAIIAGLLITIINSRRSSELYESAHRIGYKQGYHQCNLFWARTLLEKKIIDGQSYTNLILQSTHTLNERQ